MLKFSGAVMIAGACAVSLTAQTKPAVRGTTAEAQAMLKNAAAHYEKVGRTTALADFTAKKVPFGDRDLYVFCIGPNQKVVAHGANPKLVGDDIETLKDVDGKAFGPEMWKVAHGPKGGGSVEYRWESPVSKTVERKISYVQKIGTDVCGVGVYVPK